MKKQCMKTIPIKNVKNMIEENIYEIKELKTSQFYLETII